MAKKKVLIFARKMKAYIGRPGRLCWFMGVAKRAYQT